MSESYIPSIQEASVPEEGSWVELEEGWTLILSSPDFKNVIQDRTESSVYAWMYDRVDEVYLFCFKLLDGSERAIAFPQEHAEKLLRDDRTSNTFSIVITPSGLDEVLSSYLYIKGVVLRKHPKEEKGTGE